MTKVTPMPIRNFPKQGTPDKSARKAAEARAALEQMFAYHEPQPVPVETTERAAAYDCAA
ncbi:hypothetical protein [Paracoccus pacificus]|uniref:Uncharacterized protein n=1 Tax=Paracoccus pacificus TaxID=1463598 RepID=A0ABW4R709_9RHOB